MKIYIYVWFFLFTSAVRIRGIYGLQYTEHMTTLTLTLSNPVCSFSALKTALFFISAPLYKVTNKRN